MRNINIAIDALQKEVIHFRDKADSLELKIEELKLFTNETEGVINVPMSKENSQSNADCKTITARYPDYPYNGRFAAKSNYIDSVNNRPFKKKNRERLMLEIEKPKEATQITRYISQDLKNMINCGIYYGLKFNNDNKAQFYFRREWLNFDGDNISIKPEFEITEEEFEGLPEYKRKKFEWIKPGGAA